MDEIVVDVDSYGTITYPGSDYLLKVGDPVFKYMYKRVGEGVPREKIAILCYYTGYNLRGLGNFYFGNDMGMEWVDDLKYSEKEYTRIPLPYYKHKPGRETKRAV